jgi:hypothetical protein
VEYDDDIRFISPITMEALELNTWWTANSVLDYTEVLDYISSIAKNVLV